MDVLDNVKGMSPNANAIDTSKTLVELDVEPLSGPIRAYINHKLSAFRGRRGYTESILVDISREISQRAQDNFLWVFLVVNELKDKNGKYATESIKQYPSGLSELYDHKMAWLEDHAGKHLQPCKDLLSATCLAYRKLTFSELEALFPWSTQVDPFAIAEKCGSFLTITGETVSLTHQSVKDYLTMWLEQLGSLEDIQTSAYAASMR